MRLRQNWWLFALLATALVPIGFSEAAPAQRPTPRETAIRKNAAATLIRMLDDPHPVVREQAMEGLTRTRPAEAVPLLVPLLHAKDRNRVSLAIEVLVGIQTRDAILPLLRVADEQKGDVRVEVAQRLCFQPLAMPEVQAFFDRQSRSEDPQLRVIAAAAMGNMLLPPNQPYYLSPRSISGPRDPNAFGTGAAPGG